MANVNISKNSPGVQSFVKVKEIKNNIVVLQDNSLKSVCICSSMNFDLLSAAEQEAVISRFQEFLNSLDFSIQIIVASRHFEIDNYLGQIREMEKKQTNELLRVQTSEYINFVQSFVDFANIMTKAFYVVVTFRLAETKEQDLNIAGKMKNLFAGSKGKTEVFKMENFEQYKSQLDQRVNLVVGGLQGLGIKAVPLNDEQLTQLYYEFYNIGK